MLPRHHLRHCSSAQRRKKQELKSTTSWLCAFYRVFKTLNIRQRAWVFQYILLRRTTSTKCLSWECFKTPVYCCSLITNHPPQSNDHRNAYTLIELLNKVIHTTKLLFDMLWSPNQQIGLESLQYVTHSFAKKKTKLNEFQCFWASKVIPNHQQYLKALSFFFHYTWRKRVHNMKGTPDALLEISWILINILFWRLAESSK